MTTRPNRRLVPALTPTRQAILYGGTVTAVDTGSVTCSFALAGETLTDVPYLLEPSVSDVVSVLRSGDRMLVLGPLGGAAGGGGGTPITVSGTAPSSPDVNDLWVEV